MKHTNTRLTPETLCIKDWNQTVDLVPAMQVLTDVSFL